MPGIDSAFLKAFQEKIFQGNPPLSGRRPPGNRFFPDSSCRGISKRTVKQIPDLLGKNIHIQRVQGSFAGRTGHIGAVSSEDISLLVRS